METKFEKWENLKDGRKLKIDFRNIQRTSKAREWSCSNCSSFALDPQKTISFKTLSAKSLRRSYILEDDIFTVKQVLTEQECLQLIEFAESFGFQHQGSKGPAFQEAVRDNDRISLNDPAFASALWERTGLSQIFVDISVDKKTAVGLNPHIRFYRYSKGQRFGKHIDDSVVVGDEESVYTLLIYLSGQQPDSSMKRKTSGEPLIGGETIFYGRKNKVLASVQPETGMALLHVHGNRCHEHEGAPVKSGLKYILRSDVLFKP